ncbi:hypothetical protein V495_08580 [Pseudogymnoascus sp. VKM F-4514 (FW-929)]|nr:hypothetical protein V495_08580 [Pseudogymnoascus sp. VKM F-4514 (FW-929)]KFY62741.1 hypothetical protein V497_02243 [Pseudogymnoascus sp. VKM F-4516 (FW-969)]
MQAIGALVGAHSRGALRRCIKPSIRPFSSSYVCHAKAPRAPSTKRQPRPLNAEGRSDRQSQRREWIEALIANPKATIAQFTLAKKAGALNIEPEASVELLRSYCNAVAEPGWEVRFCREHKVDPSTLSMISMVLQKNPARPLRKMGENMAVCAAVLGDLNSIVAVLHKALRNDQLHHPGVLVPMTKLKYYANQGNAEAMVMYGRILDRQKKYAEAAEMFQKVAETPRDGYVDAEIGNALVQQGDLCYRDGKKEEARMSFKKAAIEFDNPEGYYKLAIMMPDEDPLKETYLLKAAASRIRDAAVEVSALYNRAAELHASTEEGRQARLLADQWQKLVAHQTPKPNDIVA